jgi:putative addiction module killer protein
VEVKEQQVLIYVTDDGKCPYEDWINSIKDQKTRVIIRTRVGRVVLGNFGDSKPVGGGVIELRIAYGAGYRVYFGRDGDKTVVLLCGGDKSSQSNDIKLALGYWEKYKENNNENT